MQNDVVFCHLCIKSLQGKKRAYPSFVKRGFSYWKDATIAFKKHESSDCHKEAVHVSIVLPEACPDVGEMLSSQHAQQKKQNRDCLLKIVSNLKVLARQGIALRGDGGDADSNFKVNGGNSGHVGNSGQRQFLQRIGRRRRPRWRESFLTAGCSVPYRRKCRRRPIRCKNCRCPELPTCPEFPPFTLFN